MSFLCPTAQTGHLSFKWRIISEYTMEQGIEDGILIKVGEVQRKDGTKIRVVLTRTLFEEGGYEDKTKRLALINKGLELFKNPDPEDTDYMRLRVRIIAKSKDFLDSYKKVY